MLARIFFVLMLLCNIAFAAGNITPEKGDITKNIHFILDYSGSMNKGDLEHQLNLFLGIATQAVDEYNLSISIFGGNSHRMIPGPDCDLSKDYKGWMAMPSGRNIQAIEAWFEQIIPLIDKNHTRIVSPIRNAIKEKIEELTVFVISDCHFDDKRLLYDGFEEIQEKREDRAGLVFIDIDTCSSHLEEQEMNGEMYAVCKAKGWWLYNAGRCLEDE